MLRLLWRLDYRFMNLASKPSPRVLQSANVGPMMLMAEGSEDSQDGEPLHRSVTIMQL